MVNKFRKLVNEIYEIPCLQFFEITKLDYEEAKRGLIAAARGHADTIVTRLASKHRHEVERIIKEFEVIKDRAEREPEDTEELVKIQDYIKQVKDTTLKEIDDNLMSVLDRFLFMMDVHFFPEGDLLRTAVAFTWPTNIEPVFNANALLIEKSQNEKQSALKERREKLVADIESERERIADLENCGDPEHIHQYVKDCQGIARRIAQHMAAVETINREEELFQWEKTEYPALELISKELEPYQVMYNNVATWQKQQKKWFDGEFLVLESEKISNELDDMFRETYKSNKLFEKRAGGDQKQPKGKTAKKGAPVNILVKLTSGTMDDIKEFKNHVPMIATLCNPGIRERHWKQMSDICGFDLTPDAGTSLRKILKMGLEGFMEQFESISGAATKEHSLEKTMYKMMEEWEPIQFNLVEYRDGICILASTDEIQTMLDDQIVKTQTMRGSPFIKPIEAEIKDWETRLLRIQDTLDEWLKVQSQWLYLEPIFSSDDIMAQMPEEGRMFKQVDTNWREVMAATKNDPSVSLLENFSVSL